MSLSNTSILVALALLIAAPFTSAGAQETTGSNSPKNPFPLECAARDLQIVAQLERSETTDLIFDETFSTIMRARRACYDARVAEGLALYDSIPTAVLAKRAQ
jgi:hypothetical protein